MIGLRLGCIFAIVGLGTLAVASGGERGGLSAGEIAESHRAATGNSALNRAEAQMESARRRLGEVSLRLRRRKDRSGASTRADEELRQAQIQYTAAASEVLKQLQYDSGYMSALESKNAAEDSLQAEANSTDPSPQAIEALQQAASDSAAMMASIERAAMKSDESVAAATTRLSSAKATSERFQERFRSLCRADPEWRAAAKSVDAAARALGRAAAAADAARPKPATVAVGN